MPFTHSFENVTPPARYDGLPWTRVRVEESATSGGVFTERADQVIAVDLSPETPNPIDITITTGTLAAGYFRFRFVDAAGTYSPYTTAVYSPSPGTPPPPGEGIYGTSLSDVGAVLRARTAVDAEGGGVELGTFTDDTRPTGTEVQAFIDHATAELALQLPDELPDELVAFARHLAALRAAMHIELTYDFDRTDTDTAAYERLKELYDSGLAALLNVATDTEGTGGGRLVTMTLASPYGGGVPDDEVAGPSDNDFAPLP